MLCWVGTVLTVGVLRLVFHWCPDWMLKCTCVTASLDRAEYVLLEVCMIVACLVLVVKETQVLQYPNRVFWGFIGFIVGFYSGFFG